MFLSPLETLIMIGAIALGTAVTRFTPFVLFPEQDNPHPLVRYLGTALPPAMLGLLVVYCLKSVAWLTFPHGIPEGLAILSVVLLHLWKRNALLSIGIGTLVYMVLIQHVFPG